MFEMVIIGGGIHGVHLAHCLLQKCQMDHDKIRIIDPHEQLLHEWKRCTSNCGMKHLRSSSVHHLDIHPFSLFRWATKNNTREDTDFIHPKRRPSLDVFNTHCQMVINDYQLDSLHIQDRATKLQDNGTFINVVPGKQTIKTRRVLLAIGIGEQPLWPKWASSLKDAGASVNHLFAPSFSFGEQEVDSPIAVIGGGISGASISLKIIESTDAHVMLIARRELLVKNFDFAPGWIGPRYTEAFYQLPIDQRRQKIVEARAKGSMPEDMKQALDCAIADKRLSIITDDISGANYQDGSASLIGRRGKYDCRKVILATGFEEKRPGGGFINQVIDEFNLKTAACGFPVVTPSLKWHDKIFVTGPLSELQIGPIARNIVGARQSSKRITTALGEELSL